MVFKKLLNYVYDSEINCRIEWFWDGGFTWYLIDGTKFPRILMDGDLEELSKNTVRSNLYSEKMKNPIYEKDWIAMGNCMDIEDALCEMFDAIIKHLPNSTAAKKLKDFDENREHFLVCNKCGDLFDCRDLGDVFSHEHDDDLPKFDGKKYVSKKQGDVKAWNGGKSIDLN